MYNIAPGCRENLFRLFYRIRYLSGISFKKPISKVRQADRVSGEVDSTEARRLHYAALAKSYQQAILRYKYKDFEGKNIFAAVKWILAADISAAVKIFYHRG